MDSGLFNGLRRIQIKKSLRLGKNLCALGNTQTASADKLSPSHKWVCAAPAHSGDRKYIAQFDISATKCDVQAACNLGKGPAARKPSRPRLPSLSAHQSGLMSRAKTHAGGIMALSGNTGFPPARTCIANRPEPGRCRSLAPLAGRFRARPASPYGPVMATAAAASATVPGVTSAGNAAVFRADFAPMLSTFRRKQWARRPASTIGIESRRRGHSERDSPASEPTGDSVSGITVPTQASA